MAKLKLLSTNNSLIVGLFVGLFFLALGAWLGLQYIPLQRGDHRATATVVGFVQSDNNSELRAPRIRFTTSQGQEVETTLEPYRKNNTLILNDPAYIAYDPENPMHVVSVNDWTPTLFTFVLGLTGVVAIVIGIVGNSKKKSAG